MHYRILICDDEEGMRRYLGKMLAGWGHQCEPFANPLHLLHALGESREVDLLLLDVRMPEMDGLEVLRRVRELRPDLPVIMMTGHGTIETAVEAMKMGAYDYLTKPFPHEKLFALIQHCLDQERLKAENSSLRRELKDRAGFAEPIFVSETFGSAYRLALQVAESDLPVLITGESGTGKELVSAAIHGASRRERNRFVAINCAALSEHLLESQLFGHLKGAFTGAIQNQKGLLDEADGGTLFLDEIGDLSQSLQAKLLRVLQEGEFMPVGATRVKKVDVRFLAATNKDLAAEVRNGKFREDLFYRLNVVPVHLPPLRQRRDDIPQLAEHFLKRMAGRTRRPVSTISPEALIALQNYNWPGNVRELQNVIERGAILAVNGVITPELLPFSGTGVPAIQPGAQVVVEGSTGAGAAISLRDAERVQIERALAQTGWNKSRSATILGITRKTLDRKLKEFGIANPDKSE